MLHLTQASLLPKSFAKPIIVYLNFLYWISASRALGTLDDELEN